MIDQQNMLLGIIDTANGDQIENNFLQDVIQRIQNENQATNQPQIHSNQQQPNIVINEKMLNNSQEFLPPNPAKSNQKEEIEYTQKKLDSYDLFRDNQQLSNPSLDKIIEQEKLYEELNKKMVQGKRNMISLPHKKFPLQDSSSAKIIPQQQESQFLSIQGSNQQQNQANSVDMLTPYYQKPVEIEAIQTLYEVNKAQNIDSHESKKETYRSKQDKGEQMLASTPQPFESSRNHTKTPKRELQENIEKTTQPYYQPTLNQDTSQILQSNVKVHQAKQQILEPYSNQYLQKSFSQKNELTETFLGPSQKVKAHKERLKELIKAKNSNKWSHRRNIVRSLAPHQNLQTSSQETEASTKFVQQINGFSQQNSSAQIRSNQSLQHPNMKSSNDQMSHIARYQSSKGGNFTRFGGEKPKFQPDGKNKFWQTGHNPSFQRIIPGYEQNMLYYLRQQTGQLNDEEQRLYSQNTSLKIPILNRSKGVKNFNHDSIHVLYSKQSNQDTDENLNQFEQNQRSFESQNKDNRLRQNQKEQKNVCQNKSRHISRQLGILRQTQLAQNDEISQNQQQALVQPILHLQGGKLKSNIKTEQLKRKTLPHQKQDLFESAEISQEKDYNLKVHLTQQSDGQNQQQNLKTDQSNDENKNVQTTNLMKQTDDPYDNIDFKTIGEQEEVDLNSTPDQLGKRSIRQTTETFYKPLSSSLQDTMTMSRGQAAMISSVNKRGGGGVVAGGDTTQLSLVRNNYDLQVGTPKIMSKEEIVGNGASTIHGSLTVQSSTNVHKSNLMVYLTGKEEEGGSSSQAEILASKKANRFKQTSLQSASKVNPQSLMNVAQLSDRKEQINKSNPSDHEQSQLEHRYSPCPLITPTKQIETQNDTQNRQPTISLNENREKPSLTNQNQSPYKADFLKASSIQGNQQNYKREEFKEKETTNIFGVKNRKRTRNELQLSPQEMQVNKSSTGCVQEKTATFNRDSDLINNTQSQQSEKQRQQNQSQAAFGSLQDSDKQPLLVQHKQSGNGSSLNPYAAGTTFMQKSTFIQQSQDQQNNPRLSIDTLEEHHASRNGYGLSQEGAEGSCSVYGGNTEVLPSAKNNLQQTNTRTTDLGKPKGIMMQIQNQDGVSREIQIQTSLPQTTKNSEEGGLSTAKSDGQGNIIRGIQATSEFKLAQNSQISAQKFLNNQQNSQNLINFGITQEQQPMSVIELRARSQEILRRYEEQQKVDFNQMQNGNLNKYSGKIYQTKDGAGSGSIYQNQIFKIPKLNGSSQLILAVERDLETKDGQFKNLRQLIKTIDSEQDEKSKSQYEMVNQRQQKSQSSQQRGTRNQNLHGIKSRKILNQKQSLALNQASDLKLSGTQSSLREKTSSVSVNRQRPPMQPLNLHLVQNEDKQSVGKRNTFRDTQRVHLNVQEIEELTRNLMSSRLGKTSTKIDMAPQTEFFLQNFNTNQTLNVEIKSSTPFTTNRTSNSVDKKPNEFKKSAVQSGRYSKIKSVNSIKKRTSTTLLQNHQSPHLAETPELDRLASIGKLKNLPPPIIQPKNLNQDPVSEAYHANEVIQNQKSAFSQHEYQKARDRSWIAAKTSIQPMIVTGLTKNASISKISQSNCVSKDRKSELSNVYLPEVVSMRVTAATKNRKDQSNMIKLTRKIAGNSHQESIGAVVQNPSRNFGTKSHFLKKHQTLGQDARIRQVQQMSHIQQNLAKDRQGGKYNFKDLNLIKYSNIAQTHTSIQNFDLNQMIDAGQLERSSGKLNKFESSRQKSTQFVRSENFVKRMNLKRDFSRRRNYRNRNIDVAVKELVGQKALLNQQQSSPRVQLLNHNKDIGTQMLEETIILNSNSERSFTASANATKVQQIRSKNAENTIESQTSSSLTPKKIRVQQKHINANSLKQSEERMRQINHYKTSQEKREARGKTKVPILLINEQS